MNEVPKYEVFISYRRDGGVDYARMIYLELKGRGYNTFFDYNSLRDGKFNEGIFKAIDECRYFILVLSNGSLDRCMDEGDWVRHEIEYALSKNKAIIPVCPSGNVRGFPAQMPESFEPLRNIQISMLQMDDLFDKSFDKIVEDRFDAAFREGRTPISVSGGITSKTFKRIGFGVISAIIAAAIIIGIATVKSRVVEKDRVEQAGQLTEKMLRQVAEEKKAADEAKERARLVEAEFKAKKKVEAELQAAREAKIRAEAEANVVRNPSAVPKESEALKKLQAQESEIKARLLSAQAQESSLRKELEKLGRAMACSASEGEAREREEADNRRAQNNAREHLETVTNDVAKLSQKLRVVQETMACIKVIDEAYKGAASSASGKEALEKTKKELGKTIARMVVRRVKAESLKDRVSPESFLKAKQLDEIAIAEHGSLVDAYEKVKAADAAYSELLDKVIEQDIARIMAMIAAMPEHLKWQAATKMLSGVLEIDPENDRARKAYEDAVGHTSPSMTVTAELNGEVVPEVRFYADSKPVPSPFHHVFKTGDRNLSDDLCFLDAVYTKDGKVYSARRYGSNHNWRGETNIVLSLQEIPVAGTSVRLKLGRHSQARLNWAGVNRDKAKEAYIDLIWCPPGSDVIKYVDPETDEHKTIVKSVDIGFWISKYELTGHQYNVLMGSGKEQNHGFMRNVVEKLPDDDLPAKVSYMNFAMGLQSMRFRVQGGPIYSDQAVFDVPSVAQWIHAAYFGGFAIEEASFSDYAWCIENAGTNTSLKVGQKKPTKLGLYDIFGNVPEWVDGTPYELLGIWKQVDERNNDYITKMGGGCSDDYEGSMDVLSKKPCHARSSDGQGRAGFRLVARSCFEHEKSLIAWAHACDLLDSDDMVQQREGLALLAKYANESTDTVLRHEAAREYVARGGDPREVGIELTSSIRRSLVYRCTNDVELAHYVLEDDDPGVVEAAYKKIREPTKEVSAHYLAGISENNKSLELLMKEFLSFGGNPQEGVDEKLFNYLALNARNGNVRAKALCGVKDPQVLKEIALKDESLYVVYSAIEKINDRLVLTEIRQESKKKKVRSAVRDRLEKLGE